MIILKKYKVGLGAVALAISLSLVGCKKDYLQNDPTGTLSPEDVFATTANAEASINGITRRLYSQWYNQAQGGQSASMIYLDMLGEDMVNTAQSNGWFISEYRWLGNRNDASTLNRWFYGFYYTIIGNANMIIHNIDRAVGPDDIKQRLKAQAYAYRAWSYFSMIQMFSPRYVAGTNNGDLGLSLVLEPRDPAAGGLPRNTVEEVYTQINKDLDDAITILAGYTRPHKSYINVNVAKGFKARVALTQQNWPVAAQMAKEARQGHALMNQTTYMAGFTALSNNEWIWGVQHNDDHPTYFYSFYAYLGNFASTNTRSNPKAIFSKLYDQIPSTDVRSKIWDPTGTNTTFPIPAGGVRRPYMSRKFILANPNNSNGDMVLMRSSEMYLIEAEALARQSGKEAEARDVLFELAKVRDDSYTLSTNSGQALIDEVLFQRRIELWGEGFRFTDLKRLNLPLDRTGGNHDGVLAQKLTEPAGTKEWVLLIPRAEIEYTMGVVVQNPL